MTEPTNASTIRPVVAIVAAKDRADTISATVDALVRLSEIDRVVVVDDGSSDATAQVARRNPSKKLSVIHLPQNCGKGGAVTAGIKANTDAGSYVLIDADLGPTAVVASDLLSKLTNDVDMVIGVPVVPAGSRGGFGNVRALAAKGIRRASGFETTAPLSGQRAIRGETLRGVVLADRFGLETALTIDVVRNGGRVIETPIDFEHRHTGRSFSGLKHRGKQGLDIVRALWSRLTTSTFRTVLMMACAVLVIGAGMATASRWVPTAEGELATADKVVVFGVPRVMLEDVGTGIMPVLDRLASEGAISATSVRTLSGRPSTVEAYASLGASARVKANDQTANAYLADRKLGLTTARELAELRTGKPSKGKVVVTDFAQTLRLNSTRFLPSQAGALGDSLRTAGKTTAVVGNSDTALSEEDDFGSSNSSGVSRPLAIALADSSGSIDFGNVSTTLLSVDATRPFGLRLNESLFLEDAERAIRAADVTVVDPGIIDRTFAAKADIAEEQFEVLRQKALAETDVILGKIVSSLPPKTMLIVTSLRPQTGTWALTPTVLWGDMIQRGYIHSPSTRRQGLIALTDIAPTILASVGAPIGEGMIGHPLGVDHQTNGASIDKLRKMDSLASYRERIYLPLTKGYVIFQTLIYLLTILLFSSRGGVGPARRALTWIVLWVAAFPLATFVFRMIPRTWNLGVFGGPAIILLGLVIVRLALTRKRHALSPLSWILFSTAALIVIDLCTGAHLQHSSVLGYSPHTAARFTGIGNAAFAALASTTVLWSAIHVEYSPRRHEALTAAGAFCGVVFLADAAPMLGADVGGILTMVPVFGLLLFVLSGRRLNLRSVATAGIATVGFLAFATAADLTRPPESRSHLGRFVTDIGTGGENTFFTTIGRKIATNVRVFTGSFWTWIVPVIAIVLLFFLVMQRGWERELRHREALRVGVVTSLLCGLLGFAVNDSGTVVTALVFVFLGPLITLLALTRDDVPTVVLPSVATGEEISPL